MRKHLLFLLFFCPYIVHAQQFGGNPPSVKWMQIKTDSLQIIYPKGSKTKALQTLHTSLYVNRHERYSIGNKVQKFTILLQNNTVTSNGFVALSPFRAVFQTTPPSNNYSLGTNNWLNELSIHETWHALQNMNFKTGIGKTFHTLFGGNGQSFITSLLIPDWYWEGDAVFMETKLTNQGRGRLPSFMEPFKSLYYAGKDYNYAKIRNGSLRDMVPNLYPLGYMMTSYGRNHYGFDFWKDILQETLLNKKEIRRQNKKHPQKPFHLFKYGFYPLDAALKYNIGTGIKGLYRNALSHYEKEWNSERSSFKTTPADTLKNNSSKTVLSYRYPHVMEDGSILTVKSGYAKNPEIIRIDTSGKEHRVVQMGNTQSQYFSYGDHKIVWATYRPDLRWSWKSYSVIRIHNLQNGKTQTLSHKSRYFSPALSRDGKQIIVTEVLPGGESQLILLDANNGKKLNTLPNPQHYFYTYPIFGKNKNIVYAGARDTLGKMSIVKINLSNEKESLLTTFVPKSIGPLVNSSDYLYFSAAYTQRIQLYALRKKDKHLFQIAQRPLGNYSLSYDSLYHRFIAGEYTAKGYQLIAFPSNKNKWSYISSNQERKIYNPYVPKALTYGNTSSIQQMISKQDHPSKRYHAIDHLFKLHSWSFQSLYPEVGLYLQSRDLLGTLQVNAGGGYNLNEKTPFIEAYALYGGLFPYIHAGIRETFDRQDYINDTIPIQWNERNWYVGFEIPLNISGSLYQRQLILTGDYHQSTLDFKDPKYQNKYVHYVSTGLSFSNYRYMTVQALNPKFGQSVSLYYKRTVGKREASQLTSNLNLYFPGLFKNHSFYLTTAYSIKNKSNEYKFSDDFSYALGYNSLPYKNIYTLGANYQLPVAYPDWGISWAYLLRIRLHLFYDYSHAKLVPGLNIKKGTFRSTGASVYFDTKLFSSLSIPIGFRVSYLLDTDFKDPGRNTVFSISFPVSLF